MKKDDMKSAKSRKGLWWIAAGIVLILAALSLALFNWHQDWQNGEAAQEYLTELLEQIPQTSDSAEEQTTSGGGDLLAEYAENQPQEEEPVAEAGGYDFIGYITIPKLEIELPVLSEWNYANLKISPCRYAGSALTGNLVIAAHNYNSHFGRINELNTGDIICFTDCGGAVREYEVVQTEIIDGYDVAAMTADDDSYDLTLFTCTWSGTNRVTVRAVEKSN
ncbi:MAG: sortase [Ruminococcus sp.]|nr:sortase [Ruminococcus sp.]